MKTGRLRRYGLRSGLLRSRAQPVKRSRGATQHCQRSNADCCLQAHALCATPPLNLLLVHGASVVQYLAVRGNYPASLAGSPRTISVSKRGPVVFPGLALLAAVGTRRWQKRSSAAWRPQGQGGFPKMRYLVTGGAGFIGSNTVDELVRRGHSVVVLDDLSSGKEDNLAEIRNKITFIKGSITDIEVVRKAMHEAEYVLHLGARTSVPRSVKDPIDTNKINIEGTLNVLVAAKELKVKRVVFAASSSAYGETPTLPKVE